MNFDPSQTPINRPPDRTDEIIRDKEAASSASPMMTIIAGLVVAVVVVAIVVAWAPWSSSKAGPSNITPGQGGADTTPIPGQQRSLPTQLPSNSNTGPSLVPR